MIPGVVLGLLLGLLLFSGDSPITDAERSQASDESSANTHVAGQVSRPEHTSAEVPPPVQRPEPVMATTPAAEQTRTDPRPIASGDPRESAYPAPQQAAVARPPAPRAKAAPSSAAGRGYRGSLAIDSDPQGARVLVNGQRVGSTPMLLDDLPAGSCVVRIEADGYEPWSTAARVVADRQARVNATLQRGPVEQR